MYLSYEEYVNRGGTLDNSAFTCEEKKAEYLLNSQSGGMTGARIAKLEAVPDCVKDCICEIVEYSVENPTGSKGITSESQSSGGVSESISYNSQTDEQIQANKESIIYNTLFGGGYGKLLYMGCRYE